LARVPSIRDVAEIASGLPEVTEGDRHGNRTWFVDGKGFVWERPFTKADLRRFGDETPPAGPIVAVRCSSLDEKDVKLMARPDVFFTIPHFDGYAALLFQLEHIGKKELREAITDAWLAVAPKRLAGTLSSSGRTELPRPTTRRSSGRTAKNA
jgi:hypothetical protein